MNLGYLLRALAILVVVIFHLLPEAAPVLIYPLYVALALFFFMAGVFYRRDINHTIRRLILPYLFALVFLFQILIVNPIFPIGSYLWFIWALIIYEISAYLGSRYPIIISCAILLLTSSELAAVLFAFSLVYHVGLRSEDLKPLLTKELPKNYVFETIGKNTLWIYLLHMPVIQVARCLLNA